MYNWQLANWPHFHYTNENISLDFTSKIGQLAGILETFEEQDKIQKTIDLMVTEAIKTSEIEGEFLNRDDVMSSIKKNIGIHEEQPKLVKDVRAKGIAFLVVDIQKSFNKPLSTAMLFNWHQQLMQGNKLIKSGKWRSHNSPMQVVSGAIGKETIHFEAPPSSQVPEEMKAFIHWFNNSAPEKAHAINNPIIRAAIAHLYFETVHPFEDGNGRIGRAIAEKVLFQGIGKPILISLSTVIEADKKAYYSALKKAQRTLDIDPWIQYFQQVVFKAQEISKQSILFSLKKTQFFDRHKEKLNDRQLKAINKILEAGPSGFEGGMNAKKYMSITKTSKATATRDLQALVELGVFIPQGGGRSVRYTLKI